MNLNQNNNELESQTNQTVKNSNIKNKLIISLVLSIISLTLTFIPTLFTNKTTLPDLPKINVDLGTIKDGKYYNSYLNWEMKIPDSFVEEPLEKIIKDEQRGKELIKGNAEEESKKGIRLLNITNGSITFRSFLTYRVLFPAYKEPLSYHKVIADKYSKIKVKGISFQKTKQESIYLDSLEFKLLEISTTGANIIQKIVFITRFNKDFIFDINILYQDSVEYEAFLTNLKSSKLNWK